MLEPLILFLSWAWKAYGEIFPSSDTKLASILGSWVVIYTFTLACIFMHVQWKVGRGSVRNEPVTFYTRKWSLLILVKLLAFIKWFKVNLSSEVEVLDVYFQSVRSHSLFVLLTVFPVFFFKVQIKIIVPERNFRDNTLLGRGLLFNSKTFSPCQTL